MYRTPITRFTDDAYVMGVAIIEARVTKADIESIVGGYHGDPFGVLGAHSLRKKAGHGRWEVRAFLPHAESAEVVIGEIVCPMAKRHPQGFFVALLEDEIRPYRLR